MRIACLIALSVMTLAAAAPAAENVPEFLSSRLADESAGSVPPDRWSATENVAWKTDLPGLGWSSPVVWGKRVFLTSAVPKGEERVPIRGLYFEGVDPRKEGPPKIEYEWKVYCLDLGTGAIAWERTVHEGLPAKIHHLKNSLASETAAVDATRVYCYFGNVGVFCFDHQGNPLWNYPIAPTETRYSWGTGASPILHGGRLYLVNDNEEDSYLLCLDAATGEKVWRVEREEGSNWATPFVWENEKRTEIVTPGTDRTRSYDLEGNLLWDFQGMAIISIPRPFAQYGFLYVTSGHVLTPDRPLYAIRPGASGDITLPAKETSNEFIVWSKPKVGPYHPTPLIYKDVMYLLYDQGFFGALDPRTGESIYERKRIPNGRAFTSSPWAYNDKIFCLNEDGVTFALQPGPDFEVLYTNPLAEDDMCLATPCIVGDRLLIRSAARLYCIRAAGG